MINDLKLTPITGTFINLLLGDTGINNYGLEEWEIDFQLMKAIGIDTVIVLRGETAGDGRHLSALDPRSTTWPEDPNLLSMFFRLCEKYDIKLYLGGTQNATNLHLGEWQKEVYANEVFYGKMLEKFGHYSCFQGLYVSLEALPWHFNFFDILIGIIEAMHRFAPEKKVLLSPVFFPLTGNMSSRYSLEEFKRVWGAGFFEKVAGKLDYCAPQDAFTIPECCYGKTIVSDIEAWYAGTKTMLEDNGVKLWANIETFQRKYGCFDATPGQDFRTIDYRSLYMKLQAATPHVDKLITFEFSSCMSPNAEWGSSARLFNRYLEMVGIDKRIVQQIIAKK